MTTMSLYVDQCNVGYISVNSNVTVTVAKLCSLLEGLYPLE